MRGCCAGALIALFAPSLARAVPPKYFVVADPRLEVQDNGVAVKLGVGCDNLVGLFEMLKDGASVELLLSAKLERLRTFWTNVTVAEQEWVSSLQHNPLTREFALCMPGETRPLLDKQLDRLLAATWSKLVIRFEPLSIFDGEEKNTEYAITLILNLQHAKPPPWLAKNFMFWSKNVLEPEKITLPFTY